MAAALALADDGTLDAAWLSSKLGREVRRATVRPLDKVGGMAGDFRVIEAEEADSSITKLVAKTVPEEKRSLSVSLGLPREALFYANLAPSLGDAVPHCFHAHGDLETGEKLLLLECLEDHVPAGLFFGPGNPNNWGVDLAALGVAADAPCERLAERSFEAFARLHARFWRDGALLSKRWLRGAGWHQGEDQPSWEESQRLAREAWQKLSAALAQGTSSLVVDAHLRHCLEASFAKVSWADFQARVRESPWTLVQGDCHPGNVLCGRGGDGALKLIDFEMVGLGSGPQELGQFLISHMEPSARRRCERDLVRGYHGHLVDALRSAGKSEEAEAYSFERCWADYVAGGMGRWLWFVPYLAGVCPPKVAQYFVDQLAAFVRDHVPEGEAGAVGQPRV